MVDERAFHGFLLSLNCANLVLSVELVASKEEERVRYRLCRSHAVQGVIVSRISTICSWFNRSLKETLLKVQFPRWNLSWLALQLS